jgi:hypothetical protein
MDAVFPTPDQVNELIGDLDAKSTISDAELLDALSRLPLVGRLDHWALWTLVCLHRHRDRQKWVGYVVESRLKGDLQKIGRFGSLGHPDDQPQSGDVPDEPEWKYFFHGCGCCLTNTSNGVSIDVDFTHEEDSDSMDPYFYSNFLLSLKTPEFPEWLIRREEPFVSSWQVEIDRLADGGFIDAEHRLRLTERGIRLAESIEPLSHYIARLLADNTRLARRKAAFVALVIGDPVLAAQIANESLLGADLKIRISRKQEEAVQSRFRFLQTALSEQNAKTSTRLAAIADLGPQCEPIVIKHLLSTPVEGAANMALSIIRAWNRPNAVKILRKLLCLRYSEATGICSTLFRFGLTRRRTSDELPRNHQVTQACIALFQQIRPDSMEPKFRSKIRYLAAQVFFCKML